MAMDGPPNMDSDDDMLQLDTSLPPLEDPNSENYVCVDPIDGKKAPPCDDKTTFRALK